MSCPDWKALSAWRRERDGVQPAGWREALAHFDGGCKACRRQALAADPTLMFRAVPVIEIPEAQEADEVEAMRQAVAAMRTASRMEALETRRDRQSWWKYASAAVLAVAALSVGTDGRFETGRDALRETGRRSGSVLGAGFSGVSTGAPAWVYEAESLPVGPGPDGAPFKIEAGEGYQPIAVVYDSTMPEGFFDT
ncbi:MAG TPA: hypothetical protein VHN15_13310 [Thermoanaerobaculia bacterium]|nr:hypothetical protein [Thermoanaerobaculia bacterium]